MKKIAILGAGIAGLAAANKLINQEVMVYEAEEEYGGLCRSFVIDGFRFDTAVHLSFTEIDTARSFFDQTAVYCHRPLAMNYCTDTWVKHPVQNNLLSLPVKERIEIIKGFINRKKQNNNANYEEWLRYQYGDYFSEKYPMKYTKKYWCCEANELSTEWVNERMYQPDLEEVLWGAMEEVTKDVYYAKEMRYPKQGGFQSFLTPLVRNISLKLNHKITGINLENKTLTFEKQQEAAFDRLISSLPLPSLISYISHVPEQVKMASKRLKATSLCLVSVGLRKAFTFPSLWFYIYNKEIPFARVYSPSMKSSENVPKGRSSLQFELYYTEKEGVLWKEEEVKQVTINTIQALKLAEKEDILFLDVRYKPYANVVFYQGMKEDRKIVKDFLMRAGIECIGRFGEWDYLWSDQSYLSGYFVKSGES